MSLVVFCCCNYFRQNTFLVVQEVRGDTQLEGYASVTPSTHLAEKQCSGARGGKAEKAGYATAPWGKAMGNTSWFVLFFLVLFFFFFFCYVAELHGLWQELLQPVHGSTRKVNEDLKLSQELFDLCECTGCMNAERLL